MSNRYTLIFSVLFLAILINYWRVPFLFWQQDEWVTFANLIKDGINITWHGIGVETTHFTPVANFLTFLCFKILGFNYWGYLITGLLFHFVNGFLIFKIAQKINLTFFYSLLAAYLFVGSSAAYQLLMWPIISLNSISLTFTLLAIATLINFIKDEGRSIFFGVIVAFFCALSLFTIEYSVGTLLFIPITLLFYLKKIGLRKLTIFLMPLFLFMILYFGFRFHYSPPINTMPISPVDQTLAIRKVLSYPFYYLGQIYIPENIIVQIAKIIANPTSTDENHNLFRVAFVFSILIILLTFYTIKKVHLQKYPNLFKIILLSFLFIFLSSLPFVLLSGKSGDFTIFPSRYLYFGSAGGALLLSTLLYSSKKVPYIFKGISITAIAFILFSTYQNLEKSKDLYDQGAVRKSILETIKSKYPKLPPKTVFYFQSDKSYYGLPPEEHILPFQAGLGQILLIWYSKENIFPPKFYQNQYLWGIKDENYMEVEGFGYGYFRNFDKLQNAVSSYSLSPENIYAFSWRGGTNTLLDITSETREQLKTYSSENLTK